MAKRKTPYLLLSVASGATLTPGCGGDAASTSTTEVSCDAGQCAGGASGAAGSAGNGGIVNPPGVVPLPPGAGGSGGVPPGVMVNPGTGGHRIIGVVPVPTGSGGTSAGGSAGSGGQAGASSGTGGVPPGVIINPGTGGRIIGVVPVPPGTGGTVPFPGIIIRPPDGGA